MERLNFIGQDAIVSSLDRSIKLDEISHSYIFEGPDGIGKSTLANIFAKTLLCEGKDKPCGICNSCVLIENGNHPDYKVVSSDSSIRIENTRDIIKDISIKPYYGLKKVYTIKDAHKMTDEAQNSLLKTLEEPPEYAVIIITTNNTKTLLPTIISRCNIKKFVRNSRLEIERYIHLNHMQYENNSNLFVSLSDGIIGNVEKIINTDFNNLRNLGFSSVQKMLFGNKCEVLELSKKLLGYKDFIDVLLNIMILLFRDLLILKSINQSEHIVNIDYVNDLQKIAAQISADKISDSIRHLIKAQNDLLSNTNFLITIEVLGLKINA